MVTNQENVERTERISEQLRQRKEAELTPAEGLAINLERNAEGVRGASRGKQLRHQLTTQGKTLKAHKRERAVREVLAELGQPLALTEAVANRLAEAAAALRQAPVITRATVTAVLDAFAAEAEAAEEEE